MTSPEELRHYTIGRGWWGERALQSPRQCAADIGRVSTVVCSASNERMTTRWQCCASAVLVIVFVVSDRMALARNQIVEHTIRDDPDLSEVRLIFKHF